MDAVQSFFPMDMGMQTDGGVPLPQSQQQPNANVNAFADDSGGGVFMGVSNCRIKCVTSKTMTDNLQAPQVVKPYSTEGYVMGYPIPKTS
jgi:hypothetical protein